MYQKQIGIDPDLLEVTIVTRDLESDLRELGGFEQLCEELNEFSRKAIKLMGFKHQVEVGAGQLKVAIIGDFSAGKSSLINSLIGEELCPVNAKPTTSSLSRFRWGSKAKVFKVAEGSETEITFDEYHGKVQHGDDGTKTSAFEFVVEYPYDALRDLEIIDTPGFGNSQNDQDTALTIKHATLADVILYLIDINKGEVGDDSLKILREIKGRQESTGQWFLVLNQGDRKAPSARARIINKLKEELGDLFDDVIAYSALWAMKMNSKSDDYWVYELQRFVQKLPENSPMMIETESTKKEQRLKIDGHDPILIGYNNTENIYNADQMQAEFDKISSRKHSLFKSNLHAEIQVFCTAFGDQLKSCDHYLSALDSDEKRAEVEALNQQIWDQANLVVEECVNTTQEKTLSRCTQNLKARELTNEELSFFFTAYGAHVVEPFPNFVDSLCKVSGLYDRFKLFLQQQDLYHNYAYENTFAELDETNITIMRASVDHALEKQASNWRADSWPSWTENSYPNKCLFTVHENIENAKGTRLSRARELADAIMSTYSRVLSSVMQDLVLQYTSQITGASVGQQSAVVERAFFALEKVGELRNLMGKIKTQAGVI